MDILSALWAKGENSGNRRERNRCSFSFFLSFSISVSSHPEEFCERRRSLALMHCGGGRYHSSRHLRGHTTAHSLAQLRPFRLSSAALFVISSLYMVRPLNTVYSKWGEKREGKRRGKMLNSLPLVAQTRRQPVIISSSRSCNAFWP